MGTDTKTRHGLVVLAGFGGLNCLDNPLSMKAGDCIEALNVMFTENGVETIRGIKHVAQAESGSYPCRSIFEWIDSYGNAYLLRNCNGKVQRIDYDTGVVTTLISGLTDNGRIAYLPYNDYLYVGNGMDAGKVIRPSLAAVDKWGIDAPTATPTFTKATGSGLSIGVYQYIYTWYNNNTGVESPPVGPFSVTTTTGDQQVSVTSLPTTCTDAQVTHKRLYRSTVGGAMYYRVADILLATSSYTDTTADTGLGVAIPTLNCSNMPSCGLLTLYHNQIYMAGDFNALFRLYFTEPYYPWKYKAAYNFVDFETEITGLIAVQNGVLVFERSRTWLLAGTSSSTLTRILISSSNGCVSSASIVKVEDSMSFDKIVNGKWEKVTVINPIVWMSEKGVCAYDGTSVYIISEKINQRLIGHTLTSAAIGYDYASKSLWVAYAD